MKELSDHSIESQADNEADGNPAPDKYSQHNHSHCPVVLGQLLRSIEMGKFIETLVPNTHKEQGQESADCRVDDIYHHCRKLHVSPQEIFRHV